MRLRRGPCGRRGWAHARSWGRQSCVEGGGGTVTGRAVRRGGACFLRSVSAAKAAGAGLSGDRDDSSGVMMAYFAESFWVGKRRGPVPPRRGWNGQGTARCSAAEVPSAGSGSARTDWAGALPRRARRGGGRAWGRRRTCLCRPCPRLGSPRRDEETTGPCPALHTAGCSGVRWRGGGDYCLPRGRWAEGCGEASGRPGARGSRPRRHRGVWMWLGLRCDLSALSLPNNAVVEGYSTDCDNLTVVSCKRKAAPRTSTLLYR